ncbi:hypothetical protein B5F40_15080 [Gordonibacter sp. An230]|uniref:glycosyltransferase family 4 protein n=1 Tax=Gordonibacter sp. An230 TaxID=1965592 RepID=UPI000B379E12|nr:glycosyltransferase family 4 protein [Gordonibacter sp. An230]OUO86389.1 hypothetical protein B5F40_15080 [Gordonibacter sp. An230]
MRILAVSQHYWPEPFNFSDICEGLVSRGHEVVVLTGLPNYPEGKIYDGYRNGARRRESKAGVRIVRSKMIPRGKGVPQRVANYFSFSCNAKKVARDLDPDFDVVVAMQSSPVMMAEPALAYAERTGAPVLLWCLDLWPASLAAGGIAIDSVPYRLFHRISRRIYRGVDKIAVTSPLFRKYMEIEFGVDPRAVVDLPQYAEEAFLAEVGKAPEGFDSSKVNLTFAGNIGSAQSVETIMGAADRLKDDARFAFHIVGSGSSEAHCRDMAMRLGLSNVVFHGRRPLEDMPAFYGASDAMIATFADDATLCYTLPRKVQSYLAAGKPILGSLAGEAARVVREARCGFVCPPEAADDLAQACVAFADMPAAGRAQLSENARAYYLRHFTKDRFFETLEEQLEELRRSKE